MRHQRLLLALLAFVTIASAEQRWLKATSTNFEVYTTAGEKKAREAVLYFEQVHSFFQKAFRATSSGKGRVRIVAFQSAKEYIHHPTAIGADGWRLTADYCHPPPSAR